MSLVEAQAEASRAERTMTRVSAGQESAVLVAVEFTGQRRRLTAAAKLARDTAALLATSESGSPEAASEVRAVLGDLDFDASLAEFEELARSAGAEIAATLVQRRAKPDAATLVGQ